MTYGEFMAGLYAMYHYVPARSKVFVKDGKQRGQNSINEEDILCLIIDSEIMLKKIKNKNMAKAFELAAQGYLQWEIAKILKLSPITIKLYKSKLKKYLK